MSSTRYGKSSSSLLIQKTSFLDDNKQHVEKQRHIASLYRTQPPRSHCKNCDQTIDASPDFTKDEIGYVLCAHCHHLNGIYEDTGEFCRAMYTEDSGEDYAKNYKTADLAAYNYRTASIYLPKAEFLVSSLLENDIDPPALAYFDFGAGSGYFVSALRKIGLGRVSGAEVSKSQADFGNAMIGEKVLTTYDIENTTAMLSEVKSQVVSMVGVLEHLQHPREVLTELQRNENIELLFISLPMFSLSVYLEMLSPDVFHRQLHGGHTHLYTERSLTYLCEEFGFDVMAEWWFGADVVDLFRHIAVTLEHTGCSQELRALWRKDFLPIVDAMQLELDKKHFSSEVHLVLRKL
ncbi:MAG: methyltransferase domain-containing protein [Pirellulaceae bacterium]